MRSSRRRSLSVITLVISALGRGLSPNVYMCAPPPPSYPRRPRLPKPQENLQRQSRRMPPARTRQYYNKGGNCH